MDIYIYIYLCIHITYKLYDNNWIIWTCIHSIVYVVYSNWISGKYNYNNDNHIAVN